MMMIFQMYANVEYLTSHIFYSNLHVFVVNIQEEIIIIINNV